MTYTQLELFATETPKQTIAERIVQYGVRGLGDRELLEGLIRPYLSSRSDSKKLSATILEAMDGSRTLQLEDLTAIKGVSQELAAGIVIAFELGRRKGERMKRTITCPGDIYKETRHYADEEQEHFVVLALNGAHEILFMKKVTSGIINKTIAHPREVFADAIRERATAVALVHNHPSGRLEPSDDDIALTQRFIKAGNILGIKVLDHLIISQDNYYSMLEHGQI